MTHRRFWLFVLLCTTLMVVLCGIAAARLRATRPLPPVASAAAPIPSEQFITCPRCDGTGRVDYVVPHPSYGTESHVPVACPRCSGVGKIYNPALMPHYAP